MLPAHLREAWHVCVPLAAEEVVGADVGAQVACSKADAL